MCHADLLPQIRDALAKKLQLRVVATPPEIAAAFDVSADFVRVSWASWRDSYVPFQGTPRRGSPMFHMSGTTGVPKGVRRQNAAGGDRFRVANKERGHPGLTQSQFLEVFRPMVDCFPNNGASLGPTRNEIMVEQLPSTASRISSSSCEMN